MVSPHRSPLFAAQERLAALARERAAHHCAVCASKRSKPVGRSILGVLGVLGAAAIVGLLFLAPYVYVLATFDLSDLGR